MQTATRSALLTAIGLVVCLTVCLTAGRTSAQDEAPVALSGFMDLQFTTDHDDQDAADFALGQAEIDVDAALSPFSAISLAVAYDADDESFGLGAAVLDFRLAGADESHRHHSNWLTTSGIAVGLFDVPIGLDWMVYPSIDRKLVSTPLVVTGTHDQWNDLGLSVYAAGERFNAVLFLTNGFGREGLDEFDDDVAVAVRRGGGGRLGVQPFAGVEIGASVAVLGGVDPDQSMTLFGADFQLSRGQWDVKAEYISHRINYTLDLAPVNDGYYVQAMRAFGEWYGVARYDSFNPEENGLVKSERLCVGAGVAVFATAELRGEYQVARSDNLDDTWVLQLAAGF